MIIPEGYVLMPTQLNCEMELVLIEMLTNCHSVSESYDDLIRAAIGDSNE